MVFGTLPMSQQLIWPLDLYRAIDIAFVSLPSNRYGLSPSPLVCPSNRYGFSTGFSLIIYLTSVFPE